MFKTHGFQLPTVFNPANLFPGGFAGFYGDPSVFPNNFTTAAGSTNATQAGDPLGRIVRLAGSLNLTQGTDAARPTMARSPRGGIRNRLSNNMMTGASAPSTLPDGWVISVAAGLTTAVGAPVTVGGVRCLPLTISGTPTGTTYQISTSPSTLIRAVSGQVWTPSLYSALIGGALTNISAIFQTLTERDSGGTSVGTVSGSDFKASLTSSLQRFQSQLTTVNGSTAFINQNFRMTLTVGLAVNITVYIGEPQVELASSATAVQKVTAAYDIAESGQPDVWLPWFDGSNDYLTTGAQSFGTATSGLYAAAGQNWTLFEIFRSVSTALQNLTTQCEDDTEGNRMFQNRLATTGEYQSVILGAANNSGVTVNDGVFHVVATRCTNGVVTRRIDSSARSTLTVGSAAAEAVTILLGARKPSSPTGFFSGRFLNMFIDRALSDTEEDQAVAYYLNRYRYGLA